MNTTSEQPCVLLRLVVGTGEPGTIPSRFELYTKQAEVPITGKYFFARSGPMMLFARS